ncbi:hypothetical protein KZ829_25605 [Actinoplanes hulinensis]|uniref:SURF1-like protein n=1 Tax=Actinoplanes hulinensis TaxID=1144547 RepID=A0ABS7B7U0_9ACTN|nr:hypothetical protein [Actinoplanes hulinensis]MBW6437125.1 hypothetical protein [Actinoplanes hulinensis]
MKRRMGLILSAALLVAGVGGLAVHRWYERPPFGPKALGAQATLRLVDQATANAALAPVNAEFADGDGDQILLGRVAWKRPPSARDGSSLRVVLLDKRRHLLPGFIAVTSPNPDQVSSGLDGAVDTAERRYRWLKGAGTQEIGGSFRSSGVVVHVSSLDASPVTFQTVLHARNPETPPESMIATAPVAVPDLLVALICVGPEGQVYWAQRLLN